MLGLLLSLVFAPFKSSSNNNDGGGDYDGPSGSESGSDAYSGRWTQNEINIQHNIDAGMAVEDD